MCSSIFSSHVLVWEDVWTVMKSCGLRKRLDRTVMQDWSALETDWRKLVSDWKTLSTDWRIILKSRWIWEKLRTQLVFFHGQIGNQRAIVIGQKSKRRELQEMYQEEAQAIENCLEYKGQWFRVIECLDTCFSSINPKYSILFQIAH